MNAHLYRVRASVRIMMYLWPLIVAGSTGPTVSMWISSSGCPGDGCGSLEIVRLQVSQWVSADVSMFSSPT